MDNREKIKAWWEYVQGLLDVHGDVIMLAFSSTMMLRLIGTALWKWPAMTAAETGTYGTAVLAFAYSNRGGGPKQS